MRLVKSSHDSNKELFDYSLHESRCLVNEFGLKSKDLRLIHLGSSLVFFDFLKSSKVIPKVTKDTLDCFIHESMRYHKTGFEIPNNFWHNLVLNTKTNNQYLMFFCDYILKKVSNDNSLIYKGEMILATNYDLIRRQLEANKWQEMYSRK